MIPDSHVRAEPRTPIALITGALGSGKTTLLRQVLDRSDRRLAVLMNEFGEIAIDSQVLPGENLRIIELAGGCVCCELAGEFEAAVNEILERFAPELIVVEATGVAEADALAFEVQDNLPQVRLDSVIHIVDAWATLEHPEIGYAARSQLQQADILLVNKVDLVDPGSIPAVQRQVRSHNDRAVLLECVRCDVDPKVLFGLEPVARDLKRAAHSGPRLETFAYSAARVLDRAKFEKLISELPKEVLRAKGFVAFSGGTFLFNYVGRRMDLEEFASEDTRLVFIGPRLRAVQHAVLAGLQECEV